ncbi:PleD family two-component system response regulator [Aquimarina sp. 2-A2]|uniref:response regulator n=1 Tax=Aquimarina sp. 2-A2 TaxID=3382644 RepID=UPI00387F3051
MGKKILVVDDDPFLGEMIKDMLEWYEYDIVLSKTACDTVENCISNKVDLIILDKLISGTDGTEVCQWIRGNDETNAIPILMMTAMHEAREVCLEAGATDFISKPFEMEAFVTAVKKLTE